MRVSTLLLFTALTGVSAAYAQGAPYSQTLDEQVARVRAGNKPVPLEAPLPPAAVADPVVKDDGKPHAPRKTDEWPQEAAPKVDTPAIAPVAIAAPRFYRDRHGEVIDSLGGGATPALPLTIMEAGDIRFVTGGVGDEEKDMLKSVEPDFNVQLLITAQQGEYISDANVRIIDASGKALVSSDDAGPFFYVALPPGNYSVEITDASGNMKQFALSVPTSKTVKKQFRIGQ